MHQFDTVIHTQQAATWSKTSLEVFEMVSFILTCATGTHRRMHTITHACLNRGRLHYKQSRFSLTDFNRKRERQREHRRISPLEHLVILIIRHNLFSRYALNNCPYTVTVYREKS